MPVFSCFTGFGFLEFSGAPSECEKVYNTLVESYRDPKTGQMTIDTSVGTHQEAKIYGWACAIAAARVTLRRAQSELRSENSYELLESHERKFGMTPGPNDTVAQRRAALAAKQKLARGPRYEAIQEALRAIYGDLLVAYHPISIGQATALPPNPADWLAPGHFPRPDSVAKSIRILTAVARTNAPTNVCAEYSESNITGGTALSEPSATVAAGHSFSGDGKILSKVSLPLRRIGTPSGTAHVKVYAADTSAGFGNYVPTGDALAVSLPLNVAALTTSYVLYDFHFTNEQQVRLELGADYVVVLEYAGGDSGVAEVLWGHDDTSPAGVGNWSANTAGVWASSTARDFCFRVLTGFTMTVRYENWNRGLSESRIVKGDVLAVDPGILGIAERIVVLDASVDGGVKSFTAAFSQPHTANTFATTGPTPIWTNTKRHVLVVVSSTAAVDPTMVHKTNDLFARVMRAPTTWAIVEETTPGAGTVGPFRIGSTSGSPLGCATLHEVLL